MIRVQFGDVHLIRKIGRCFETGSSTEIFPSSTRIIKAVQVIGFD